MVKDGLWEVFALLTLGSMFSGIGGFELVASWYGIEPIWASEIESAPISITKRHFPNMKHLGDITKINGAEIEPVDIITFGSPCQDLSVAGKRGGMVFKCQSCGHKWDYATTYGVETVCPKCDSEEIERTRSSLFTEAIRIIKEMREATNGSHPTWAIWENVPGALSSNDGMDFRAVLQSFADTEIPMPGSGRWANAGLVRGGRCDVGWRILDAQFWGVPQRRKRVFVVADFRGQRATEVLFKPESLRGYFAPGGTQRKGTSGDAESSLVYPSVARTLAARHDSSPCADRGQNFVYDCRGNGDGRTAPTLTIGQDHVRDFTAIAFTANDHGADAGSVSPTLRAGGHDKSHANGGVVPAICIAGNTIDRKPENGGNGVGAQEELAYTLTSIDRHAVAVFMAGQGAKAGSIAYSETTAPTLKGAGSGTNQTPTVAFGFKAYGHYEQTDKSKTIMACDDITTGDLITSIDCRNLNENENISGTLQAKESGGYSLNYTNPVRQGRTVRRLTPVECERLQGYPDNWTKYGHDGKEISDSARYKACGNSLALPCVEHFISGIVKVSKSEGNQKNN